MLVDDKKYIGKYVALGSFRDKTVVASGTQPADVISSANQQGYHNPVVVFVPEKETIHIY